MTESFPEFFSAVPPIRVRDPLAAFLGAARDGVLEFRYADAVRLAGHSCPTVASAWLMTRAALRALYGEALPERGGVRVAVREAASDGVAGVIANVAALIVGAAGEGGFKGIGGRFDRRNLLAFGQPVPGTLRFLRADSGASVDVTARLDRVPGDPRMGTLLPRCATGVASADELQLFGALWQDRVRRLLLEHGDDPAVIVLS